VELQDERPPSERKDILSEIVEQPPVDPYSSHKFRSHGGIAASPHRQAIFLRSTAEAPSLRVP
jgi:hypothetical protein